MNSTAKAPECAWCDDTGVMWDRRGGSPASCSHCEKGTTDDAVKYLREVMERRKLNAEREKVEAGRILPGVIVKYSCLKCRDTGFRYGDEYPATDRRHFQVVPCECRAALRKKAQEAIYLKLCRLPEARQDWTLEKFEPRPGAEEMLQFARDIVAGILSWLTVISESGYGKTHLAVGVCREFLKQGKSARYIYVPDLILELKQGFDEVGMASYQAKMNFFKNVSLLALDDLGTENSTPWVREQLDTIIDHRYVEKLPLIVTTNKPLNELMPRVSSRLKRIELDGIGEIVIPTCDKPYDEYKKRK